MPKKERLKRVGVHAGEGSRGRSDADGSSTVPLPPTALKGGYPAHCLLLLVCGVYYATLYRSVAGGDSGELVVAACRYGVAHPPGYPLFTVLGALFHLLPFGSPAFRVNLLSGLLAAGAAVLLYYTVLRLLAPDNTAGLSTKGFLGVPAIHRSVAFMIGAGYAFSPLIWLYSNQAEVFAMNNFFVALVVYLVVRFQQERSPALAQLGALSVGLGLSNQHTLLFFALPLVPWILWIGWRSVGTPQVMLRLALFGIIGMSTYIYLPWATVRAPPGAWGDSATSDGFLVHFLRKEYGTFRLFSGNEQQGDQLWLALRLWVSDFQANTLHAGIPLLIAGTLSVFVRGFRMGFKALLKSPGFALLLAFTFYMFVFHMLSNLPIEQKLYLGVHMRFWMQPNFVAFAIVGVGFAELLRLVRIRSRLFIALVCFTIALTQLKLHYWVNDQSENFHVKEYGHMIIDPLPANTTLLVKGDIITNSIRYLRVCEGFRPDITHLDQSMMTYKWYRRRQERHHPHIVLPNLMYNPYELGGYSMRELLLENEKPGRILMLCGGWYHDEQEEGGTPGFKTVPMGYCDAILPQEYELDFQEWDSQWEQMMPRQKPPQEEKYNAESWEHVAMTDYWSTIHKRAHHALLWGMKDNDQEILSRCAELFEFVIAQHPDPPDYYYKNLGIAYGRLAPTKGAEGFRGMVRAFKKYLKITKDDPTTPDFKEIKRVANQPLPVGYTGDPP